MIKYRLWAAVTYELLQLFCEYKQGLRNTAWVRAVLKECFPDWVEWKTQQTMADVDRQTEELHQRWAEAEKIEQAPIITEQPADDSNAQQLLGGEMRIRAPWVDPE